MNTYFKNDKVALNEFQKFNKGAITKMVKEAREVYAYTLTSVNEGSYLRVYKNDLLAELNDKVDAFDHVKFNLNETTNILYIN